MQRRSAESFSVYVVQRHFRRVLRGYDPDEVDAHLERISRWFAASELSKVSREHAERLAEREAAAAGFEQSAQEMHETAEHVLHGAGMKA
jgi:DivIVA domain-containing protein